MILCTKCTDVDYVERPGRNTLYSVITPSENNSCWQTSNATEIDWRSWSWTPLLRENDGPKNERTDELMAVSEHFSKKKMYLIY